MNWRLPIYVNIKSALILSQFAIPFLQILGDLILSDFTEQHHVLDTLNQNCVHFVPGSCLTRQMTLEKTSEKQHRCQRVLTVSWVQNRIPDYVI
jgi:hypothetical protein